MATQYRIVEWDERYEVDTKGRRYEPGRTKRKGPLLYLRMKINGRRQGPGWRRLLQRAGKGRAAMVFGIYVKLAEIAGDAEAEERGYLPTPEETSFLTGLPIKQVEYAYNTMLDLGWINAVSREIQGIPGNSAPNTIQYNTVQYITPRVPLNGDGSLSEAETTFDEFRKAYPGTKRGLATEFANYRKKHKDWREVLPDLLPALKLIQAERERKRKRREFLPEWPHLQTWVNQRRWEQAENVEI